LFELLPAHWDAGAADFTPVADSLVIGAGSRNARMYVMVQVLARGFLW
jgi:hypothetical protein